MEEEKGQNKKISMAKLTEIKNKNFDLREVVFWIFQA